MTTGPDPRKIDRYEPPNYLARYRERQARQDEAAPEEAEDTGTPLYLRRFRSRPTAPLREQSVVHLDDESFSRVVCAYSRVKDSSSRCTTDRSRSGALARERNRRR